ncbi:ribosomal RNA small subunit methyltransferase A [Saccharomonospora viridis]|uniref:ribosomal RNA small subunit methyltransferase A n=1 Tax=Saccharomonospora viridis TaxID=1852 RepID=UPI00240A75A6|nr:rRNA adenine dimethyltransferase family protein [Saccharomonospora viridis]
MPRNRRSRLRADRPNLSGVHFLVSKDVLDTLVRTCTPGPDDLVLDLGAGPGVVTAALARTHARVLAVERDPEFVRTLNSRFRHNDRVRVIQADIRTVALPRRDFLVVANPPYSLSTPLLRRLLGGRRPNLRSAALTVEWGFAKRVTTPVPASRELAWWASRFDIRLVRKVPADHFRPQPTVDSAVLAIRRRPLSRTTEILLGEILDAVERSPYRSAHALVRRIGLGDARRLLKRCDIEPGRRAATITPREWRRVAETVSARLGRGTDAV